MASTTDTIINEDFLLGQLNASSTNQIEQEVVHSAVERNTENNKACDQQYDSSANQMKQEEIQSVVERKEIKMPHRLTSKIQEIKDRLATSRKSASECSIYKVPIKLRQGNEIHFTPRIVSIGPFYHGDPKYADMEQVKMIELDKLIEESTKTTDEFLEYIKPLESAIRDCYSEKFPHIESDKFVEMMLVDAAFIYKIFDTFAVPSFDNDLWEDEQDSLSINRENVVDIKHDIMLLENQLPFIFIDGVMQFFSKNRKEKRNNDKHLRSIKTLANIFWPLPSHRAGCYLTAKKTKAFNKFAKFLVEKPMQISLTERHLLYQLRLLYLPAHYLLSRNKTAPKLTDTFMIRSAKKLQEAGVRAENGWCEDYAMFTSGGKLKVLPLEINDTSETIYRNIMAYEQCHYKNDQVVSDYIILMEMLIRDNSEEILVTNGVIVNKLSGGVTATTFLRNLCKNVSHPTRPFQLGPLCEAVEKYCDRPTRKVKAALTGALQIGGAILLILTVLQTIFAALALYLAWKPPRR